MSTMRKRITHIITGLDSGGAEYALYTLLSHQKMKQFSYSVISLSDIGPVGEKIRKLGIPVTGLMINSKAPNPLSLQRLITRLRQISPDLIQTWMYHADLLGGLTTKIVNKAKVVWGIHHTTLNPKLDKYRTIVVAKICALISPCIPDKIVCCSQASREVHTSFGYSVNKMVVIENGIDDVRFKPNISAYSQMRKALGIPEKSPLIGLIGRFHPLKGHRNFIEAAARLHALNPSVHFLLCGENITMRNRELVDWIDTAGIMGNCHLIGQREDMPSIYNTIDIGGTSSIGEAFPLVIGEAMACCVPCVVTDVGDSANIVGDTGLVVQPDDSEALANSWSKLLSISSTERRQLGERARQRIIDNFGADVIAVQFAGMWPTNLQEVSFSMKEGEVQLEGGCTFVYDYFTVRDNI